MTNARLSLASLVILLAVCPLAWGQTSPSGPASQPAATRPAKAAALRAIPGVQAFRDIEYANVAGQSLRLDVYTPEKAQGPLPLIVWIHGGGWIGGNKGGCPPAMFVTGGYVAASVEYRFSNVAKFPAQIEDCKGAIRFLRANAAKYGIDPNRIGVWGSSAGGHLVALLGTSGGVKELEGDVGGNLEFSSSVQAVCDYFGPTDLADPNSVTEKAGPVVTDLIGGTLADKKSVAVQASPLTYVSKNVPPFFIAHGDKDPLVPLAQSQALDVALKKAGVDSTLYVVPGGGHGFGPQEGPVMAMVREFFDKHFKSGETK